MPSFAYWNFYFNLQYTNTQNQWYCGKNSNGAPDVSYGLSCWDLGYSGPVQDVETYYLDVGASLPKGKSVWRDREDGVVGSEVTTEEIMRKSMIGIGVKPRPGAW